MAPDELQAARAARDALWAQVSAEPYASLPDLGSAGVGNSMRDSLRTLLFPKRMAFTFRKHDDALQPRAKLFHPFGTVACVEVTIDDGSPYTGLLGACSVGLVRLSWATNAREAIAGVALKLFAGARETRNVLAVPSLEPQQSAEFFERAPTTRIPMPRATGMRLFIKVSRKVARDPLNRPVKHLCTVAPSGAAVASPSWPEALTFVPGEVRLGARDMRLALAELPAGTLLYRLSTEAGIIGTLTTSSPFVASAFGDRRLHFHHSDTG